MAKAKKTAKQINLQDPQYYFNRELSWLEFNRRVLHEALDPRTPLLERLKFCAIFSSNLDEFFMVRVAGLKEQVKAGISKLTADGRTPSQQLEDISQRLSPMVQELHRHFETILKPELVPHGVRIMDYPSLNEEQSKYLEKYFQENIFPVLTPLAIDHSHPFPYISNLSLNLAVVLREPDTDVELFARIKVPKMLPRFISFPEPLTPLKNHLWVGVPLEQVITHNLAALFPGMKIQECHPFRITRNADLELEEEEGDDLLLVIKQELQKRRFGGSAVRLEINSSMPESVLETLLGELSLEKRDVYQIESLLGLADLIFLTKLPLPQLKEPSWYPVVPPEFRYISELEDRDSQSGESRDIFRLIQKSDLLLHHPYHSFRATVNHFITDAASDPQVLAIKMTLYRTSGDSPIINALIAAAENDKQVAVLVELKARFDEENNILWARKLEQAGVHVVYGLTGLKTHTKIVLVVRQEEEKIRRYVHIATGNYNPKTANLYTDLGLLSCRPELGADLTDLFNYLTGYSRQKTYRQLLVAPVNLREQITAKIEREAEICRRDEGKGRIIMKMNSLVDADIIASLYQASQAGVKIDLIVRGICCLRPGVEGVSENIKVISIIGRFLEHSRIFYFQNGEKEEIYLGSADLMKRNLNRRVEAVTPVEDPKIRKQLQEILAILQADNRQAWELQSDGSYLQRKASAEEEVQSAHQILMEKASNSVIME